MRSILLLLVGVAVGVASTLALMPVDESPSIVWPHGRAATNDEGLFIDPTMHYYLGEPPVVIHFETESGIVIGAEIGFGWDGLVYWRATEIEIPSTDWRFTVPSD